MLITYEALFLITLADAILDRLMHNTHRNITMWVIYSDTDKIK